MGIEDIYIKSEIVTQFSTTAEARLRERYTGLDMGYSNVMLSGGHGHLDGVVTY